MAYFHKLDDHLKNAWVSYTIQLTKVINPIMNKMVPRKNLDLEMRTIELFEHYISLLFSLLEGSVNIKYL